MIELYKHSSECCGCAACMNICPMQAITMKPDANGFIFPKIDNGLCIECGLCKIVCAFQNVPVTNNMPLAVYAAINKNKDILLSSASGGIFGAVASLVLERHGVVFGCAYNEDMEPEHICVDNEADIKKIQGSKYVQSSIKITYTETKKYLKEGRLVLFTGTPCQIAGLKSYLGRDYDNLITIDIICHGVPNANFFKGYIKYLEEKLRGKVIDFRFRDKSKSWGLMGKVIYKNNGKILEKLILPITSYYYNYFLKGYIYRDNCYECKYACDAREGDFTMGDYWGVEIAHPQIKTKNGVSLLLINSKKGMSMIVELNKYLYLTKSTLQQAREHNGQLNRPTAKSNKREIILKIWSEEGYQALADEYYKSNRRQIVVSKFKMLVPQSTKAFLKKALIRR